MKTLALILLTLLLPACAHSTPTLTGQPSWLPLGEEVYHSDEHLIAEKQILHVRKEPRWFLGRPIRVTRAEYETYLQQFGKFSIEQPDKELEGFHPAIPTSPPYPNKFEDLPTEDQGATLSLRSSITPDTNHIRLTLQLTATSRQIYREVEHRWTNPVPLLFAFYIDGKALQLPDTGFGKAGGVNSDETLVESGATRTWSLTLDPKSVEQLLPDNKPHTISIIAAFSERQHEGYSVGAGSMLADDVATFPDQSKEQILLRSNPTHLHWPGTPKKSQ
jgi:hypothetical protein